MAKNFAKAQYSNGRGDPGKGMPPKMPTLQVLFLGTPAAPATLIERIDQSTPAYHPRGGRDQRGLGSGRAVFMIWLLRYCGETTGAAEALSWTGSITRRRLNGRE